MYSVTDEGLTHSKIVQLDPDKNSGGQYYVQCIDRQDSAFQFAHEYIFSGADFLFFKYAVPLEIARAISQGYFSSKKEGTLFTDEAEQFFKSIENNTEDKTAEYQKINPKEMLKTAAKRIRS